VNLYSRLGWRRYGTNVRDPDVGILLPMVLVVRDQRHLERVRSLFLPVSRAFFGRIEPPDWVSDLLPAAGIAGPADEERQESWSRVFHLLSQPEFVRRSIFSDMPEETVKKFLDGSNLIECRRGEMIIKKDTHYRSLLILLSGRAEVRHVDSVIADLAAGDIIGELAFLLGVHRTADIYADSDDVQLLQLSESRLRKIVEQDPQTGVLFYANLARILALRVIAGNQERIGLKRS